MARGADELQPASARRHDALAVLRRTEDLLGSGAAAHEERVTRLACLVGQAIGLPGDAIRELEIAAGLHDIGKVAVPASVLHKPQSLTAAEQEIVRAHAVLGYDMLSGSSDPLLRKAARIARHHHERWCGGGYPDNLSGQDICLEARIVTVCDVYDALRENRVYRAGLSHAEALEKMLKGDGRMSPQMFDPEILRVFAALVDRSPHITESARSAA